MSLSTVSSAKDYIKFLYGKYTPGQSLSQDEMIKVQEIFRRYASFDYCSWSEKRQRKIDDAREISIFQSPYHGQRPCLLAIYPDQVKIEYGLHCLAAKKASQDKYWIRSNQRDALKEDIQRWKEIEIKNNPRWQGINPQQLEVDHEPPFSFFLESKNLKGCCDKTKIALAHYDFYICQQGGKLQLLTVEEHRRKTQLQLGNSNTEF
jgi:hypothetical protein